MGKKDKKTTRSDDRPTLELRVRPKLKPKKRPAGGDRGEPKEIAVFDPDAVEKVLDSLPPKELVARAADRLGGLGSSARLEAVIALGAAELCVGDVAAVLALSMSATSTMLKQLRALGLVTSRHAGKQIYYKLSSPQTKALIDLSFKLDEPAA
ncbi:MAG: metalloregulator ArsR/SmtB family transcription factor [Deltaproteobacteria bacterium]|nr:metalloregulator ArsR/SmtB family transcription factor [Deltaproteobacteria bacterium]